MHHKQSAIFAINLLQDVNILRPLVFMATRDFGFSGLLLVSSKFIGRDLFGIWQNELEKLCAETGAQMEIYSQDWEAHRHIQKSGVIFAASESSLPAHDTTHNLFRYAPPTLLKVTLQHGYECVGFRHSADHVKAHGKTVSFGADIVCAWHGPQSLHSMAPSQRGKLHVTGPSSVLQLPRSPIQRESNAPGIVCENLHSVRLKMAGDFKTEFVDAFGKFCALLAQESGEVVLRPHPGGQYVLKNQVALPFNAEINNAPMYRLDLRQFSYGISAPSSVLIDMLLADIPTAVWRDQGGRMDVDSYADLTAISTPKEWLEFSREAIADPAPFQKLQQSFLKQTAMPLAPQDVFERFSEIFQAVMRKQTQPAGAAIERERIQFLANSHVPTLQLSFEKPLAPSIARGEIFSSLLTEQDLRDQPGLLADQAQMKMWISRHLDTVDPSVIVFCRYSGPGFEPVIDWARQEGVPVIYHIDDDLLAIPLEIGERKYTHHNAPERIQSVRYLLNNADLVYASTEKLKTRLLEYFPDLKITAGKIYCSGSVMRRPENQQIKKIGYMASADHEHNLRMVLPAITRLLDHNSNVQFELFGSIPVPPELMRFGTRISTAPPITNYGAFLEEFSRYRWDVGICPLAPIDFNLMKANTKWVEYTTVGAAVVASRHTVYDECCADGCGMLPSTSDEWFAALERIVNDDAERIAMVERAQKKLNAEYSTGRLRDQVLNVIECATANARHRVTALA
jgi:glycosyltransferase involved in cell wall biosynthesis